MPDQPEMPPRIIHLPGGLRALDDGSDTISVQVSTTMQLARFDAPPYAQLYSILAGLGLSAIGVEFVNASTYAGHYPPDWEIAAPTGGFVVMEERNQWRSIRHAAHTAGDHALADMAARSASYLSLMAIRLIELSNRYNLMLANWMRGDRKPGRLFGDLNLPYIDAAIHAFVADAGSYRDLLAEITWRVVLGKTPKIRKLAKLIREEAATGHPIAASLIADASGTGWLKQFGDLRDAIVHVAPIGRNTDMHSCTIRELRFGQGDVPTLHYPLLDADGSVHRADDVFDISSNSAAREGIARYKAYMDRSIDALDYAVETVARMVALHRDIRLAAGLSAEPPLITDKDVIGPIVRVRPSL